MKKRLALLLPLLGLALSSCSFNDIVIRSSSQEASSSSNVPTSSSSKPATTLPSTYESLAKRSIYELSSIPTSVIETKFLVIPVWFANSSTLVSGTKPDIRGRIQKAFFGSEEETGWHSVKTYYERESHGKKQIQGVVSEWYESPRNAEYYAGSVDESTLTGELVVDVVDWFFDAYPEEDRTDYDKDGDGYIDALSVIYAAPNYTNHSYGSYYAEGRTHQCKNFWAYVYWLQNQSYKNIYNPGANAYLWASYDFSMQDTSHCTVDAHAYIHETGHLFGLEDYYDYAQSDYAPAGGYSMQDCNVGGHDPYSVISLGWGTVNVPDRTTTYKLQPFESSGQVILLSNDYQNSVFDEYLLIEFYTPTGLNALDVSYQYASKSPKGPNIPGIRLWHVDSRLIARNGGSWKETDVTNTIDDQHRYRLVCTNNSPTADSDADTSPLSHLPNYSQYRLLSLLRATDYLGIRGNTNIANRDLFVEGDSFDMYTYRRSFVEKGKLNNHRDLGWSFTVDALTSEEATITVTKL